MAVYPQNPALNSPLLAKLLQEGNETGQGWKAEKQANRTNRHGRQASSGRGKGSEGGGGGGGRGGEESVRGTGSGLAPLTTGPGLPSNP